ncbi:protein-tyrosine phosphatase-like protein [Pilobolus umbonatus]|nr:protein-tyrosine phosphatase-like protein [Pilobolus umbonatus]
MNTPVNNLPIDKDLLFNSTCTLDDWQYEMRRDIQEIIPGLYLGPYSTCRQIDYLKSKGITHVLSIIDGHEAQLFRTANLSSQFQYNQIQVDDSNLQNLIQIFPLTFQWIHEAISMGGKVVVCCNGGMSRSPTFVIAYIMELFQVDAMQAYHFVQGKRLCINPNDGFKSQLKEYEPIYRARQSSMMMKGDESNKDQRRRRRSIPDENDKNEGNMYGTDPKRAITAENIPSPANNPLMNTKYSSMLL